MKPLPLVGLIVYFLTILLITAIFVALSECPWKAKSVIKMHYGQSKCKTTIMNQICEIEFQGTGSRI